LTSFVRPALTQGSASAVLTVTSGFATVQSPVRRAFQTARSPQCHTTTKRAPSPILTAITKPSVATVPGGNTSDNGLTVAVKRTLQSRPRPEVTTRPPPAPQPRATPLPRVHHHRYHSQPQPTNGRHQNPIFLAAIKDARAWHPPPRSKPLFKFKLTEFAARTNLEILESYKYDLQAILLEDAHLPLRPGRELCSTAILDPVLQSHNPCGREPRSHFSRQRWHEASSPPPTTQQPEAQPLVSLPLSGLSLTHFSGQHQPKAPPRLYKQ